MAGHTRRVRWSRTDQFPVDKVRGFFYDLHLRILLTGVFEEYLHCRCSSRVEQLICNQQVGGSIPLIGSSAYRIIVLCRATHPWWFSRGRFPSGQRGQTVNLLAQPSEVRILPSPSWCTWCYEAGIAQLARAPAFQAGGRGFESRFPLLCSTYLWAHVAQEVEHFLGKEEVIGSSPIVGSA